MNQVKHKVLSDILELMTRSHSGKQGGGYGCLRKAAQITVDKFGKGWISPQRGNPADKWLHDWCRCSIKLSCPPNSNVDKVVGDFFKYAKECTEPLQIKSINRTDVKITAVDLLRELEQC